MPLPADLRTNVAQLRSYGPVGALVISYELLMIVLRTSPRAAATAPAADTAVPEPPASLNGHGHAAAERYAADLPKGDVPGVRRIRRDLKVGQPRAQEVRDYLTAPARA